MPYRVILFDLDGTLTDPTEGITKSVQYALSKFDIGAELDQLRTFIGPPLHHSFMNAYGFDEPTAKQAVDFYREYFSDRGIYQNQVFEGVPALLENLRDGGRQLCVVTSKPGLYAERILEHFELASSFGAVVAPGLDLADAEKSVLIKRALNQYTEREPADFVMVGDREHDIIDASANGIDAISVTYGAGSHEELTSAAATHVVDSLPELQALLL